MTSRIIASLCADCSRITPYYHQLWLLFTWTRTNCNSEKLILNQGYQLVADITLSWAYRAAVPGLFVSSFIKFRLTFSSRLKVSRTRVINLESETREENDMFWYLREFGGLRKCFSNLYKSNNKQSELVTINLLERLC